MKPNEIDKTTDQIGLEADLVSIGGGGGLAAVIAVAESSVQKRLRS